MGPPNHQYGQYVFRVFLNQFCSIHPNNHGIDDDGDDKVMEDTSRIIVYMDLPI